MRTEVGSELTMDVQMSDGAVSRPARITLRVNAMTENEDGSRTVTAADFLRIDVFHVPGQDGP